MGEEGHGGEAEVESVVLFLEVIKLSQSQENTCFIIAVVSG